MLVSSGFPRLGAGMRLSLVPSPDNAVGEAFRFPPLAGMLNQPLAEGLMNEWGPNKFK